MITGDERRQTGDDAKFPTIGECLLRARELESVSDSARLDVEILLAKVLDKPRSFLYAWPDKVLTEKQVELFFEQFERRLNGEPIAYILGVKEFWSLTLAVNQSTIIPRPETELLVEKTLELLPTGHQSVLDLGTGTGAIALALATERPEWKLLAVDCSPKAVQLAINNCRTLGLTNVEINRSDWYSNVHQRVFDAIVCNPPYIAEADPHLQLGDVRFEPASALVAKANGMADIEIVIAGATKHLANSGWLLVEHGWDQAERVRSRFKSHGFSNIATKRDLAGLERISFGQFNSGHSL